jgi:WD40 repeat protein
VWDIKRGKELRQLVGHGAPVRAAAFSPDGKLIVTGGDDQTARMWDAQTGKETRQFVGHTAQVSHVAISPDGQFVLTGSADASARVWNAKTGELVRQFGSHVSAVMYIAFADQGKTVITGDAGNLYRWRTLLADVTAFTCAHLTRDLKAEERALYGIPSNAPTCSN